MPPTSRPSKISWRRGLTGRCTLIRFADDAVLAFEDFLDAKRVLDGRAVGSGRIGVLPN
jgi:hypothetical protein